MAKLFEKLNENATARRSIPLECYELLSSKSQQEQEIIYRIILEIDKYKKV